MSGTTTLSAQREVELPADAPQVRITVGMGSAGQKTWVLKKPVTLIGSRRPAHIKLHDRGISPAHCLLINTGDEVLLKDLNTSTGTRCNGAAIDLVEVKDGNTIEVGGTSVQVAIRTPTKVNKPMLSPKSDPTKFPKAITMSLNSGETSWSFDEAAILIGRHERAPIQLNDESVSSRHAVIIRFMSSPILFDLGSRTGVGLNDDPCSLSRLVDGDTVQIGPYAIQLTIPFATRAAAISNVKEEPADQENAAQLPLGEIEAKLKALQVSLSDSWDRLNSWNEQDELAQQEQATEAEDRDIRDAAIRGQLHDLTRYHEEISAREKELFAEMERIKEERADLVHCDADLAQRAEELDKREEELERRENAVAQRWTRLRGAKCVKCGNVFKSNSG